MVNPKTLTVLASALEMIFRSWREFILEKYILFYLAVQLHLLFQSHADRVPFFDVSESI